MIPAISAAPAAAGPDPAGPDPAEQDRPPVEAEILRLTQLRGADKSICPSEVARLLVSDGNWQPLMSTVRRAAIGLARAGLIDILRKGRPIAPGDVRGVIRLRWRTPVPNSSVPPPDPPPE